MYKVYDYHNQDYLRQQGQDHPAEFPDRDAAVKFLEQHKEISTIPPQSVFTIHEDTMHKDLKSAFETYYDAKIEVSFNSPEGHVTVLHHEDTDRFGVAYLNLDTQEVSSKGGFQNKDMAVDFADEIKEFGMDMEKTDINGKELLQKEPELEFDR
jgi:hypothetical protein